MSEKLEIFDDGLKTYDINGDSNRQIKFNPTDMAFGKRILIAKEKMEMLIKEVENDNANDIQSNIELIDRATEKCKVIINEMFNADVFDKVFNGACPFSTSNGSTLIENFLNAIINLVERENKVENSKLQKRIALYQKEYK